MDTTEKNKSKKEVKPDPLKDLPVNIAPVYTDKAGNTFYQFTNDMEMKFKRFFSAQVQDRFIKLGLTETFMQKVTQLGLDIAFDTSRNEKQLRQDIATVFQNIKMRLGYVCSDDAFMRLAAVFFVLPDEPLDECVEGWTQKKIALWNQDPDSKAFFLQQVFKNTMELPNISLDAMQNYFQIARERESNIPTLPRV